MATHSGSLDPPLRREFVSKYWGRGGDRVSTHILDSTCDLHTKWKEELWEWFFVCFILPHPTKLFFRKSPLPFPNRARATWIVFQFNVPPTPMLKSAQYFIRNCGPVVSQSDSVFNNLRDLFPKILAILCQDFSLTFRHFFSSTSSSHL